MKNSYFLDSSYAIALVVTKDQYHQKAIDLSFRIEEEKAKLVTTRPVLLEIGNSLSRKAVRGSGLQLLRRVSDDSNISIVELTVELYESALSLFAERPDKEWGLIDSVSFVVMRERGIEAALTTDNHFIQAGFRALLRED